MILLCKMLCLIAQLFCCVNTESFCNHTVEDSLFCGKNEKCLVNPHKLKLKEIVAPMALIGVSALAVDDGCLSRPRDWVEGFLSAEGKHKIRVDDYLQYAPILAVYGLNFAKLSGRHKLLETTVTLTMSSINVAICVNLMKLAFGEHRPGGGKSNSFPSGHTATAFMGAELLRKEYRESIPWIGWVGYSTAVATGYLRIYNNRHYVNDVVAGACIGILSTKFSYS